VAQVTPRERFSFGKGDGIVSETEVKTGQNGANGSWMPLLGLERIALPSSFGEIAEWRAARAQEAYEKIKSTSEEMAETLRETYSSNAESATAYGLKVIEISHAYTASAIDFLGRLLGSKSVTDVVSLSAAHANKTFDSASAYNKQLWELAQTLTVQAGTPIRSRVAKTLDQANSN
jgi:phasin